MYFCVVCLVCILCTLCMCDINRYVWYVVCACCYVLYVVCVSVCYHGPVGLGLVDQASPHEQSICIESGRRSSRLYQQSLGTTAPGA